MSYGYELAGNVSMRVDTKKVVTDTPVSITFTIPWATADELRYMLANYEDRIKNEGLKSLFEKLSEWV